MPNMDFSRYWKTIVSLLVLILLISTIITVLVIVRINRSTENDERASVDPVPLAEGNEFVLRLEDLMIPNIADELWRGIYRPVREYKRQWGMEELRQFYFDPVKLATENLRLQNEKKINNLLNDYR